MPKVWRIENECFITRSPFSLRVRLTPLPESVRVRPRRVLGEGLRRSKEFVSGPRREAARPPGGEVVRPALAAAAAWPTACPLRPGRPRRRRRGRSRDHEPTCGPICHRQWQGRAARVHWPQRQLDLTARSASERNALSTQRQPRRQRRLSTNTSTFSSLRLGERRRRCGGPHALLPLPQKTREGRCVGSVPRLRRPAGPLGRSESTTPLSRLARAGPTLRPTATDPLARHRVSAPDRGRLPGKAILPRDGCDFGEAQGASWYSPPPGAGAGASAGPR
jgi:hypothetical protein